MRQAMGIMGTQFVLGRTIKEAGSRAKKKEVEGYRYSFDMLGEAARTMEDADIYFNAYKEAIKHIGESSRNQNVYDGAGISVKLSAIHPRYEFIKSDRLMEELVNRLKDLAVMAKERNLGFTIDAEEADRLEILTPRAPAGAEGVRVPVGGAPQDTRRGQRSARLDQGGAEDTIYF